MKTTHAAVAAALALAGTEAFLPAASNGMMVRSSRAAAAPMRMAVGDDAKRAADQAGMDALRKAENAANQSGNSVSGRGQASSSSGNAQARATVETTASAGSKVTGTPSSGPMASKETVKEAPLTAVHVHENTEVVDKTRVEQERIKTEVVQKIQPIHAEERKATEVKTVDHGTEVRTHGSSGINAETQAELERRRKELAATTGTTREATKTHTSARPDVVTNEQTKVVEQVIPVLDKDVYIPKREEHEKKIVEVYNEPSKIVGSYVDKTISVEEFEKQYGTKIDTSGVPSTPPSGTVGTSAQDTARRTAATANTSGSSTVRQTGSSSVAGTTRTGTAASSAAMPAAAAGQSAFITEHQRQQAQAAKTAGEEEKVPYSMSSSNMAHDAAEAAEDAIENADTSGSGIGSKIAAPFKAVGNAVKNIVD